MNVIFDGNYLFWKSYSVWSMYHTDRHASPEENEQNIAKALHDKEQQQVLLRKCIIDMCKAINRFSFKIDTVTVVIDSHSWRYTLYDDYKYALTKVRGDSYVDFLKVLDMFEKLLRDRGLIVSRVNGAEGDDLLYFWSFYFSDTLKQDVLIITGDSDIRQLINKRISIFCNNSKNLHLYCDESNIEQWKKYQGDDNYPIVPTRALDIILYKVIMGDTSDNIPKLKKGFGKVAFDKFITFLGDNTPDKESDFREMAHWILLQFSRYNKIDFNEAKQLYNKQIRFNLGLTWLNCSVYPMGLVMNILDDIAYHKHSYSYKKPYTLEDFYNLTIK